MLTPDKIQALNQATGNNVNPNASAGAPSQTRAQQILDIGSSSNQRGDLGSQLSQRVSDVGTDFSQASKVTGNPLKDVSNAAQGGLRVAGDVAGGVMDTIGHVLKPVTDPIMNSIKSDPMFQQPGFQKALSTVGDAYSKLVAAHPGAVKDITSLFNLAGVALLPSGIEEAGNIATRAVGDVGDLLTAGKNVVSGAKDTIGETIGNAVKGKSLEDIIATPESQVSKLNPTERKAWFDNQKELLDTKHEQISQGITSDLQTKAAASQTEAEQLQKQLATTTRDKVIELRPKIVQAMGKQSQTYRQLIAEDMAGKEKLIISPSEIRTYVANRYPDNPQMASAITDRLGLNEAKVNTTVEKVFNQTKALKQDLSAGARGGTKVFTADDKLTDEAISNLTGYLKDAKGVDFKNANQFWSKYAPVRNQLISEAKPFLQTGTQTKTFASTLSRVAKGTDVNNENFINEVEGLLKEPINTEAKGVVSKLGENEKTAIADKMKAESAKIENQMAKDKSLKSLSDKQFEIERASRMRDALKNVLKYVVPGIIGEEVIRRL